MPEIKKYLLLYATRILPLIGLAFFIAGSAKAQFYELYLHQALPAPANVKAAKIKTQWLWLYTYQGGENQGLAKKLKKQNFDANGFLVEEWVYDTLTSLLSHITRFKYDEDGILTASWDEKDGIQIAQTEYSYSKNNTPVKIQKKFQDGSIDYTLQYQYDSEGRLVAGNLDYGSEFENQNKNIKVKYARSKKNKVVLILNQNIKNKKKLKITQKQLTAAPAISWAQRKGLCKTAQKITSLSDGKNKELAGYTIYFWGKRTPEQPFAKQTLILDAFQNIVEQIEYGADHKPARVWVYAKDYYN
jgi:hypothetical protein